MAKAQTDFGFAGGAPFSPHAPDEIAVCGKTFLADPSGALWWAQEQTLVVADLHLEKGSAAARAGSLLPPYDSRTTLLALAALVARFGPSRVLALGDSFHDEAGVSRMGEEELELLRGLQRGLEWLWITGNHDPEISPLAGGRVVPVATLSGLKFRHEPAAGSVSHEIAGHLHPAARLTRNGGSVRRKCFVANGARLVLPAFGAYTGGLNVLNPAFRPLFGQGDFMVWMLGGATVYPVPRARLGAD
ncbi:MAG: ligase-associated DNA damage response endonuclease PdeM [Pseudomonadota bacterium]|nr:ligase-associated DNA damage response endonuclease PdeM [Pseudomonadota bacterium]